ncbi:MAG: carbohydrate binding family 9 domain-containing protein [Holophagales bacterium]|nr:carbohydrate binding family 9 domain-containing protein [Holophagales bacterium]MYG29058.1 carbohydrate binding family 9 domain-containing protein [Holophagales bacterium]MYI80622.1 carbohydrate binding family 9 domain-containing protein [Holophagales bacterium]
MWSSTARATAATRPGTRSSASPTSERRPSRSLRRTVAGLLLAFGLLYSPAAAQTSASPRPTVDALRIDTPIRVDGVLDEAVWDQAPVATGFTAREPEDNRPAAQQTEFSVLYTETTLYFGIRAHDPEPEAIVARELQRDSDHGGNDDSLAIVLDTFHDQRNSVTFEVNPLGARTDSLVTDEGKDQNIEWNGVWTASARVTAEGWQAEVAIPFTTLRFEPAQSVWGLNVRRVVRRTNEESYWAPIGREIGMSAVTRMYAAHRVSLAGDLAGISNVKPGRRLDVKPFLLASAAEEPRDPASDTTTDIDGGIDVKWGLTRSLTLDLTYNTDFAQVEVDQQQVNLTRFSLFFPEKREFFLENAGIFEFGPPAPPGMQPPLMKAFFSRRIGLAGGEAVPIDVGARLTGRAGAWNLGLLTVGTEAVAAGDRPATAATQHSVFRLKRDLGERSSVGMIYTELDPRGGEGNRLYGVDVDYKPNRQSQFYLFGAASEDQGPSDDTGALGAGWAYTTRTLRANVDLMEAQSGFDPGSGFLLRRDFRRYNPRVRWEPRINRGVVRSVTLEAELDYFERESLGRVESRKLLLAPVGMRTTGDDRFRLAFVNDVEQLFEPFEISPGIAIPAGLYEFDSIFLRGFSNQGRRLAWRGNINVGEFFGGDRRSYVLSSYVRLSRHLLTEFQWNYNDVMLPQGDFTATIYTVRLDAAFSPDLRLNTLAQYNDAAQLAGVNVRFNWIYKPGANLFVVYNHNWDAPIFTARETARRELIVKFNYLWQP